MVATLVLCAMLLSAWVYKITHNPQQFAAPSPPLRSTEKPDFVSVGQVTDMHDCVWKDDNTATIVRASIRLGRKYSLAAGLMEITYKTGAKVILEGPCDYEVYSNIGGHLALGKLTARVEKANPESRKSSLIPRSSFPSRLPRPSSPTWVRSSAWK